MAQVARDALQRQGCAASVTAAALSKKLSRLSATTSATASMAATRPQTIVRVLLRAGGGSCDSQSITLASLITGQHWVNRHALVITRDPFRFEKSTRTRYVCRILRLYLLLGLRAALRCTRSACVRLRVTLAVSGSA